MQSHSPNRRLPLGALAAGFGLLHLSALAQTPPAPETALQPIKIKAQADTENADRDAVRATTSTIGKGNQALRDIPQSVTIVTGKLIDDRKIDTVKEALHSTAGITFLAAEGGEEDIRLRGFSLAASGDIYVDGLRDPAFYDRDVFSYDRIELLRGSASMLFGRGSTGGVVNQVSKVPVLADTHEVNLTGGSRGYGRFTGDFNLKTGETSALRINVMGTNADSPGDQGNRLDKQGIAPTFRFGIGTADEFTVGFYHLQNRNGINYGLPWLREKSTIPASGPAGIIEGLDPTAYYGARSDYNAGSATLGTVSHTHRFDNGGQLKSSLRQGYYDRDQRASVIRFCVQSKNAEGAIVNPDCPTLAPDVSTINEASLLTVNPQNKVQNMHTTYVQSDYSQRFDWFGLRNDVLTGVDLAHETFVNYTTPPDPSLNKNVPRTTIGSDNGTISVDESLRKKVLNRTFDAKAAGVYVQDLIQVAPHWKLLGGLRWDYFDGQYNSPATTNAAGPVAAIERSRTDSLWSRRFGVLYQPTDKASFHFSYGTSFNTSGDTYQYDDQTANTGPESSENLELGAKIDAFDGKLSTRVAVFRSTKLNERNRDPDSAAVAALLSGRRHAAGVELDIAGRLTSAWEVFASYAWTPVARIDVGAPGSVPGVGEGEGTRSALTPRHSGTVWTTYQLIPAVRVGGGLNARSSQTPNRNPAGIVAPSFVTGDLMAEYTYSDAVAFKLNVNNVTNKLYADSLYSGHYVPGQPRRVLLTMTARF